MRETSGSYIQLSITDSVLHSCDLTPQQKFIYILVCSFCNDTDACDLTKLQFRLMTRLSPGKIDQEIEVLRQLALVSVEVDRGRRVVSVIRE